MSRVEVALLGVVVTVLSASSGRALGAIGFADNQADRIRVWNDDYYELAFRKADGRLLYMIDKTTGQQVSPGNVHGPWVLRFSDNTWLDGEHFSPTNGARLFSYSWDSPAAELTLTYHATGTYACDVTLVFHATEGPEIESTLSITSQSGCEIELLAYPVQLSFQRSQIDGVYVPYLEGMRLLPSFFATYEFGSRYPGQMFADFAYTELTTGSYAVFMVHDLQASLMPAEWLILKDDGYAGGVNKYHHDFEVVISNGQQWSSPTTVFSVGSSLGEAMVSYWMRNGHDAMPTLEQKLGASLFDRLANAVLLKRDFLQGSWTFASFQAFLPGLPADNLLHFVAFWPNGFDENYPDYLPPNPALGTLTQFQDLVSYARSTGHLVMPYTNPTWWDNESPTYAALGSDIVARNRSGGLIWETYNGHGGYVVSPHDPDVIARQDQTRNEFTQTVPCDLMFEDQVGARNAPTYDGHPDAPDPIAYVQGLADVAERSSQWLPVMSEGGYDRLSWFEAGHCNSHTIGWHSWPDSTYTAYPLAPLWVHESLYFNAHNLAGEKMANDLSMLTYYVSMGYALSHDLSMLDADWLEVLDCFQKHLLSPLIGGGMTSYAYLSVDGQTETVFDNGTVITANLTASAMSKDDHVIAPDGFLAERDGRVLGGVLTTLNGEALSGSSPHYLAIEPADYRIAIYQPRGDNGTLTVSRPADWVDPNRISAVAVKESGGEVNRAVTVLPDTLQVYYVSSIVGQPISHFVIVYCRMNDADCDGDIDFSDYQAFEDCYSGPGGIIDPTPPFDQQSCLDAFDDDLDLDIDLDDFYPFQNGYSGGG